MIIETIITFERSWKYILKLHFYCIRFDITKKAIKKNQCHVIKPWDMFNFSRNVFGLHNQSSLRKMLNVNYKAQVLKFEYCLN
jgi:hypothetical protein